MKTALLTLLVLLGLELAGGIGFIYSGLYDVAAVHPDNALIAWAIHKTSDTSVDARLGGIVAPAGFDAPDKLAAGARLYAAECVLCHGGPGLARSDVAMGLNPSPPDLFRHGRRVDPAEAFWFVSNGVKMTAMPGFSKSRQAAEIWSLVAFVTKAPGLSTLAFSTLTGLAQPAAATGARPANP